MKELPNQLSWVPEQQGAAIDVGTHPASPPRRRFLPRFVRSLTKPTIKSQPQERPVTSFQCDFMGCMDLYADPHTVSAYLDRHQDWFIRCAEPMQVESIGDNGYILTIGRYASFGYEMEPKIAVKLLPQDAGTYRLETIELPDIQQDYQIDFQAAMTLVEDQISDPDPRQSGRALSSPITHVKWTLDLGVQVSFPAFIHRLPMALIQRTGTRLLNEVVQRVSKSLTEKVRRDFHQSLEIPLNTKGQPG